MILYYYKHVIENIVINQFLCTSKFDQCLNTIKFKSTDGWNHFIPRTKHRTIAKPLRATGNVDIYLVTYIANTTWPKITRDWYHKSLSDQHATKLGDFLCWKGCCGSPGFFWFVSFGCLLWGVNFLYEKGQSLSRQYFITIWWFPQVLSPNHRLVFIAKSNVFLSSTIWCLKHQLHDHSLACSWNGSQSSHDNGWPIFVSCWE